MIESYKHYIVIDSLNRIIDGWSMGVYPEKNTEKAILLTDDGGYHFTLMGEDNPPLFSQVVHIPLYKWDGSKVIPRTEEEIEADRKAIPPASPTEQERLRSDVDYLSMMTGVDLPNQEVMV